VKERIKAALGRDQPAPHSAPANMQQQALQQFGDLSRAIDWSRTLAYSAGPYLSIRLNLKGREQCGQVEPGEFKQLRDRLIAELNQVINPFSGERDLDAHPADELYHGPHMQWAPDILGVPQGGALTLKNLHPGQDLPGAAGRAADSAPVFLRGEDLWPDYPGKAGVPGTHRMNGILICRAPGRRARLVVEAPTLLDIAPTALALLSLPAPSDMDGRVLLDLPEATVRSPSEPSWTPTERDRSAYTDEDAAKVEKRLKDLGYL